MHSASTWQVPQTSTVWFYCRTVYYGLDTILALRLLAKLHRNFSRKLHVAYINKDSIWFCRQGSTMEGITRLWYATIFSSTHPWLAHRNNSGFALLRVCQTCFTSNYESIKVVYSCQHFFAVQLTLFWLFWSWRWKFPFPWHQLRWLRSPFYRWSNEMGLCFAEFWGISRCYGSPHKLA